MIMLNIDLDAFELSAVEEDRERVAAQYGRPSSRAKDELHTFFRLIFSPGPLGLVSGSTNRCFLTNSLRKPTSYFVPSVARIAQS